MSSLQDRYAKQIAGVFSYFDRIVVTGTIPQWCYADGMSLYLRQQNIRMFDYTKFAEPLHDEIRANSEQVALENGIELEYGAIDAHYENLMSEMRRTFATMGIAT